jgi:hypothetical protein
MQAEDLRIISDYFSLVIYLVGRNKRDDQSYGTSGVNAIESLAEN